MNDEGFVNDEVFLITGAFGCIGSWVMKNLVDEGVRLVAMDLAAEPVRPRLLLSPAELANVTFSQTDITDLAAVRQVVEAQGVTHIIHLAGLQIPFCKANPSLGAAVNVTGTVNIFESVRYAGGQVRGLAYASSLAVFGPAHLYPQQPVPDEAPLYPETLYGVYKQANEQTARLYWQDWQVGSVGLRPYIVFGVSRDQGLTSDISKAILAAAAGRSFHIKFGGAMAFQYANDVARMFIEAARANHQGAATCNLRNDVITVADFVALLKTELPEADISHTPNRPLPFPANLDDSGLRQILSRLSIAMPHTPLATAIQQTVTQFKALLSAGQIDLGQLEA